MDPRLDSEMDGEFDRERARADADRIDRPVRPDRRRALSRLLGGAGCALAASMLDGCTIVEVFGGSGSDVRFDLADPAYSALAEVGGMVPVDTGARRLLLVRVGEQIRAMDRICTHTGCDMSPARNGVWDQASNSLICTCHSSVFDIEGRVVSGPAMSDLTTYPVEFDLESGNGTVRVAPDMPVDYDPDGGTLTIDLADDRWAPLRDVGGKIAIDVVDRAVLVVRFTETDARTLDRVCTHQQCDLGLAGVVVGERLACTCHGSQFNADGSVAMAPAEAPLRSYPTEIDVDAGVITVAIAR